jgi:hypothetical protein
VRISVRMYTPTHTHTHTQIHIYLLLQPEVILRLLELAFERVDGAHGEEVL